MDAHATCGRGTEIFAREEVIHKLKADMVSVEDGKIFFKVCDSEDIIKILNLKTVERVFATIAHFPSSEIRKNGKVKFLHDLKDRVLDYNRLEKAADHVYKLQRGDFHLGTSHHAASTSHSKGQDMADSTAQDPVPSQSHHFDSGAECRTCLKRKREESPSVQQTPHENHSSAIRHPDKVPARINGDGKKEKCKCGLVADTAEQHDSCCTSGNAHLEPEDLQCKRRRTHEDDVNPLCHTTPSAQLCGGRFAAKRVNETHLNTNRHGCSAGKRQTADMSSSLDDVPKREDSVTFRVSVKCAGWCRKWLQPQRLAKECGQRLSSMTGWTVKLQFPDIEICIHINDDFVTAGIPLTRQPLSKRSYILDPGLRSTIAWIMAHLAEIQPGDQVLDPMCGKATILLEAAQQDKHAVQYIGCDRNEHQLEVACRNVIFAHLTSSFTLLLADATTLPLRDASVDKVVCDAPFGQKFTVHTDLSQFYCKLLREMCRVLVPGGRIVLLTSHDLQLVMKQYTHTTCDDSATSKEHQSSHSENVVSETKDVIQDVTDYNHDTSVQCDTASAGEKQRDRIEKHLKFQLRASHYVKLGETHAYIMVMDKDMAK